VSEETDLGEVARLLAAHRVKRVPVVRDGRVVGVVSRADLLRALAAEHAAPAIRARAGFLAGALAGLDEFFAHRRAPDAPKPPAAPPAEADGGGPTVARFQHLVADHERQEAGHHEEARRGAAEQRRRRVAELIDERVTDERWRALLHQARRAAESGQKELLLLRFPGELCADGGRAINVTEPGWPATLRGEAAEIHLRWERELKPRGFVLGARVLDFPEGVPGDIGLFLIWGS
jgi:CBS domain-containing protein